MLNIKDLSFWEKSLYFEGLDFTIIGAGIVGLSTAIFLKEKFPRSKILILERGYLPSGASTKNAGFACFGSPTELYDDLSKISDEKVWNTFSLRYEGLKTLFELIDAKKIGYEKCGSWDLISKKNLYLILISFFQFCLLYNFYISWDRKILISDYNKLTKCKTILV